MTPRKKKDPEVEGEQPELEDSDTIETGSSADEAHVSERPRVPTDTAFDVEPSPTAQAELERIRTEEDEARTKQEEAAAADNELREKINAEKVARDDEEKLGMGTPPGVQVDQRGDVELGSCLACGKPVTADEGYMRFPGGITHMHECARNYQAGLSAAHREARDVSHDPNEVRHPNVLATSEGNVAVAGDSSEPLNPAAGSTAMPGYGGLAKGAGAGGADVTVDTYTPDKFDTPIRDAVAQQRKDTEEYATAQQEA